LFECDDPSIDTDESDLRELELFSFISSHICEVILVILFLSKTFFFFFDLSLSNIGLRPNYYPDFIFASAALKSLSLPCLSNKPS
jgi:hypothetical protein